MNPDTLAMLRNSVAWLGLWLAALAAAGLLG
jgi:hypothetical protein